MSRQTPARRLVFALGALLCATTCPGARADDAAPFRAGAQAPHPRVALFASGPSAEVWTRALVAQWGALERDPAARAAALEPGIARARMDALAQIEALLLGARGQAASLHEADALASLAAAERIAEGAADVPGIAAWMAEVQLQLGAVAAQAGLAELAQAAFRRAATLDPARRLLPAEAAPDVVATCARIHAELAAAPAGVFTVQVQPAGARVFLDDSELGASPVRARAVVGRHALRVEARGHARYGAFIDVLPGERLALAVQLTERPRLTLARSLQRLAQARAYTELAGALRDAPAGAELTAAVLLETSRSGARALIVRCDAAGCEAPIRAQRGRAIVRGTGALSAAALAGARVWLASAASDRSADDSAPLWQRWYVWGGGALALAAGALAVGLAAAPDPEQRLRIVVDRGGL